MKRLTILHDTGCAFCRRCVAWLKTQPKYLELEFLAVDSPLVANRYPGLKTELLKKELTVVDDEGGVYYAENAYVICLYALRTYREWSVRLSNPAARPLVRRAMHAVTEHRHALSELFRNHELGHRRQSG